MKYAILSDIHSNIQALQAVIQDMQDNHDIDEVINLGDIVGYGAHPNSCITTVANIAGISVMGNHDSAVCDLMNYSFFNPYAKEAIEFTKSRISGENMNFLKDQPIEHRIGSAVFVHSSPMFPENWSYILNKDTANFVFVTMDQSIETVFIGHSHIPTVYIQNGEEIIKTYEQHVYFQDSRAIVNVGSVGQPRDGDSRACYAIFDTEERMVTYRRVKYDIDTAFEDILSAQLPAILAERLKRGK